MTPDQGKFHDIQVLKMTNNDGVRIEYAAPLNCFSLPLEDCNTRNILLPHRTLKELWATSEF